MKQKTKTCNYTNLISINPHITNLSNEHLIDEITKSIKKYLIKTRGRNWKTKTKTEGLILGIFPHQFEIKNPYNLKLYQSMGLYTDRQPHIHIINNFSNEEMKLFSSFLEKQAKKKYIDSTYHLISIKPAPEDQLKVIRYCDRFQEEIYTLHQIQATNKRGQNENTRNN